MIDRSDHVTACIPYFGGKKYIRRAVESLLSQTHSNLTVVVVNDGDPDPPWDVLHHIKDKRLIRFNLSENHGPYFALEVVRRATSSPFFLLQDADDWSTPNRLERLLGAIIKDGSDFSVSSQAQFIELPDGQHQTTGTRWDSIRNLTDGRTPEQYEINLSISPKFSYRIPHMGLFRTHSIMSLGGYYAGFKISFDTLITNLILMTGSVSHVPLPLYYRLARKGSLTNSLSTGFGSDFRKSIYLQLEKLYNSCYLEYYKYTKGNQSSEHLSENIREILKREVNIRELESLNNYTSRILNIAHNQL